MRLPWQFEADTQNDSYEDRSAEFAFDGSGRSLAGVHEGGLVVCPPWIDGMWTKCSVLSSQNRLTVCSSLRTEHWELSTFRRHHFTGDKALGRCGFHASVHARRVAVEDSKDEGQRG